MPVGVIINSLSVVFGGIIGALVGKKCLLSLKPIAKLFKNNNSELSEKEFLEY